MPPNSNADSSDSDKTANSTAPSTAPPEQPCNREHLIARLRRDADVRHAEDAADRDAGLDRKRDETARQQPDDPVEDVEGSERKARGLPSEK